MVARLKVLLDLNVILDVLQRREPFYTTSARVLASAEIGQLEGWVAAHSITTLFYLLSKDRSPQLARVAIGDLLSILSVASVDGDVVKQALSLPYDDFEDAVQMMAAAHAEADYLVTRDVADYKEGPLPVVQPAELLALL
ncbi:MAG: PIN domain-containing protein [Anaerolineae bacterium]|jgi:predicted nucleic acid-binding protein